MAAVGVQHKEIAMWNRLSKRREYHRAVDADAEELISAHGDQAYRTAREAMRLARMKGDPDLERYMATVALAIAERSGREVGVDTATRMEERR